MEKTSNEESFRKSQQLSKDSESFLQERKMSGSRSRISSFGQTQSKTRYIEDQSRKFESTVVLESKKKALPKVLKVSDKEIRRRQSRKS
jgi:hypothetical protein